MPRTVKISPKALKTIKAKRKVTAKPKPKPKSKKIKIEIGERFLLTKNKWKKKSA